MGAPIQKLWHHVSHWPLLNAFLARPFAPASPEASERGGLDKVAVTFKECEDACEPTAEQIEARERERAERFKRDQLLPIMGIGGGSPSPPS
ncbi:MAG: hypothetical protein K0Q80_2463 [Microvirga sp.]|nr:hypothetical protein [Microvirga sp.]